jgi:hypothetical protein
MDHVGSSFCSFYDKFFIYMGGKFKFGFDGVMDGVKDSGGNGCKNEVL